MIIDVQKSLIFLFNHIKYDERYMMELFLTSPDTVTHSIPNASTASAPDAVIDSIHDAVTVSTPNAVPDPTAYAVTVSSPD